MLENLQACFFSPFSVLSFENLSNSGSSLNASIPCTSLCNFRPLWCLQERLYYPLRVCLSCPRAELRSCRHITLNGPHNQFYLSFLIMNTAILSFTKYRRQSASFVQNGHSQEFQLLLVTDAPTSATMYMSMAIWIVEFLNGTGVQNWKDFA